MSKTPLSAEQNDVYSGFLTSYTNGSTSSHLDLGNRTVPLDLSKEHDDCLNGIEFEPAELTHVAIHQFASHSDLPPNVILVDPAKQMSQVKVHDPEHTMRQGAPVNDAVESAFASGLLTLSEIAFDKTRQYAVMDFSFVCGGQCGHGGIVILHKIDGKWTLTKRQCSSWI